ILAAEKEVVDESIGMQKGLDEMIEQRSDGTLYYLDRIWVPLKGDVRTLIMDEAHKSRYSVPPGADKMYYNLRDRYWWSEGIAIDFVTKLPRTSGRHDIIWVIVDRLIKSGHFLPIEDMLRACVLDFGGSWDVHLPFVEFLYKNSYHSSVRCASFEALYGSKCRSPFMRAEIREGQLIGHEKLASRYVGSFEIAEKVGLVAYRLDLPEELNGVHEMFYMSNLKKCLAVPTLQVPLDEIQIDVNLNFVEEPMEI
nr:retrotransposon protein, putative, Ty3-gypsy subclass [Tanacetum cinerariifolium]